ncbi:MAG TPA: type II toxin-antitoxin system HicA family toxin [Afifellaceae bacterium]|nr:type II toxin-antitoxin system HicA family toxin [Afifellaceae bacterium]
MKAVSGRAFARLLERRGWRLLRVAGSHHIYGRQGSEVRISVPIHGNRPLKIELLRHLAKLADIPDEELRS